MYNQYLDGSDFILLDDTEPQASSPPPHQHEHADSPSATTHPPRQKSDLLGEVTGGLSQLLGGVRKHFSLEKFDTGDILLVLIILFLYLEGDNLELVITLGLLLLLGLGDD